MQELKTGRGFCIYSQENKKVVHPHAHRDHFHKVCNHPKRIIAVQISKQLFLALHVQSMMTQHVFELLVLIVHWPQCPHMSISPSQLCRMSSLAATCGDAPLHKETVICETAPIWNSHDVGSKGLIQVDYQGRSHWRKRLNNELVTKGPCVQ